MYTTRYEKVLYCTIDACQETKKCNYDRLWQQKNIIQHQLLTGAADKITPKKAYSKNLMKYIPLENSRKVNAKKSCDFPLAKRHKVNDTYQERRWQTCQANPQ